jgi:hypothetical protein
MGLRDLSDEIFEHYKRSNQMHHLQQAFSSLPVPEMPPTDAYRRLVRNQVERVPLDEAANRIVATSVVPYPPDIPMMMPGGEYGSGRWTLPWLSQGVARLGSALPRLWTRNPWGRGQGRRAVSSLSEAAGLAARSPVTRFHKSKELRIPHGITRSHIQASRKGGYDVDT